MEAAPDRAHLVVRHKTLLTGAVMLGVLIQVLDSTIANVALPHMEASLGATHESITWVLTSYIIASAMALPLSGWLASAFGKRRLFLLSITLFVAASMLCGAAATLPLMVAARIAQGVGGAFLGPLGQMVMLDVNRPSDHGKAMALYGMGIMVGPVLGPVLGGWLTENLNWRWVFYINVPLGLVAFAGIWALLPGSRDKPRRIDLAGWALIAVALGAFQLMLDRGDHVDWFNSAESWIEAGIAASAFWMFAVHNFMVRLPLFPMAVLRDRNLMVSATLLFVLALVQLSNMALLPSMLQLLYGYPVLTTGLLLASRGLAVMFSMWLAGRIIHLLDSRLLIGLGMVLMDLSLWKMSGWTADMDWYPVVINGLIQGLGMGFIFVPLSVVAFATVPPAYRPDATGLYNLFRNTGGSVGIAVATAVLARNSQVSHADLAAHVTPYNLAVDPTLLTAAGNAGEGVMEIVNGVVTAQAAMIAYLDDFHMMMLASIAALPLLLLLRRNPGGRDAKAIAAALE